MLVCAPRGRAAGDNRKGGDTHALGHWKAWPCLRADQIGRKESKCIFEAL